MTYVGEKQLGNVLSVGNANNGDVIGTGTEIAQSRAIIFNQVDVGVTVTLATPTPPGAKLIVVANRGTESITVGTTVIEVGPAYGLFWDGTEFVAQEVEGIGRINSSTDTDSIAITGDGSPIDPLSLDVRVNPISSNALTIDLDGLYVAKMLSGDQSLLVVDGINGNDLNAGTPNAPFATITKALATIAAGGTITNILVYPGTYNEDLMVTTNTRIVGILGSANDQAVKLTGRVQFAAAAGNSVIKNMELVNNTTSIPTLYLNTTTGDIVFDNCYIHHTGGPSVEAVRFNNASGNYYFTGTKIEGKTNILSGASGSIRFLDGESLGDITNNSANVALIVKDFAELGPVTHGAGDVSLQNIGRITVDGNNDSIISSAASGILLLMNVSLVQEDGSIGDINKTGLASYAFSGVSRDSDNNTFAGTALLVSQATDIHANYTPSAYTPADDTIPGHLAGIDDALTSSGGALSAVTSSDSSTIDFEGAGTLASPLTGAVKISAASNNAMTSNIDGLYVPTSDTGLDEVTHANSDTIDITGSGTLADPLIAEVSISTAPNNQLSSDASGLLVPAIQKYIDVVFNTAYNWLSDDLLIEIPVTREFTLPQGLTNSQIVMKALANVDISTSVLLHKVSAGVSTQIGTITFNYSAATDTGNTLEVDIVTVFNTATVFSAGDYLTLTTADEARFSTVTFALLASRPLGT